MYRNIFITLFVLTSFACQSQRAQISENAVKNDAPSMSNSLELAIDENTNEVIEPFSDDTKIGVPHKNKVELAVFKESKNLNKVVVNFYSLTKQGKWESKQTIEVESGALYPNVQLKDFNNDGFKDMTFVSAIAGRGANDLRTLLIYDEKSNQLILIKNSADYPNLFYNKKLSCIGAQRFYGGNTTEFARIENDTLKTFAYVETYDTERKVYSVDKDGKAKLLRTDRVSEDDLFELYKTYNPPTKYTAKEIDELFEDRQN